MTAKELTSEQFEEQKARMVAETKAREPEFIVGEVGAVFIARDRIGLTLLPWNVTVGEDLVEHEPITPAQAFLLGTALLQAAKVQGLG